VKFRTRPRDWEERRDGPSKRHSPYWEPEKNVVKRKAGEMWSFKGTKKEGVFKRKSRSEGPLFPLSLFLHSFSLWFPAWALPNAQTIFYLLPTPGLVLFF
jgi:hypothetical protein